MSFQKDHPVNRLAWIGKIGLFVLLVVLLSAGSTPPPQSENAQERAELQQAFSDSLRSADSPTLTGVLDLFTPEINEIFITPSGDAAVLWLALRDERGKLLATEPGLLLAVKEARGWRVINRTDPTWQATLESIPPSLLPGEIALSALNLSEPLAGGQALNGYYLPYAAGTSHWLEGSISHFFDIPELGYPSCSIDACHYAYDFTDSGHFPLLASKAGTVFASRDGCPDGGTNCTNYIVLKEGASGPYQIYMHMANGTIPDKLTPGVYVQRGEYLGDSDDTGYSTSQHVHFMVTNSVWQAGDGYYWGNSVDIRFADVPINNGIPRTCYEVTNPNFPIYDGATQCLGNRSDPRNPNNDWFVSGNTGAFPPDGHLIKPFAGQIVAQGSNPIMDVRATANDDVRVKTIALLALINEEWREIGPRVTQEFTPGTFDWDVDLCSAGPLNGPLTLGLKIWDHEGNVVNLIDPSHLITIQVDHACPPPVSHLSLAQTFDSTALKLSWSADTLGVPIQAFQLQWRVPPAPWEEPNLWNFSVTQQETWFVGSAGATYAFRLRAIDANGQAGSWPANDQPDLTYTFPINCQGDGFEPDNTPDEAHSIGETDSPPHNLCGPGDDDWFRFQPGMGGGYSLELHSLGGGAALKVTIFGSDGLTPLLQLQSAGVGQGVRAIFTVNALETFYFKVEGLLPALSGTEAEYDFSLREVPLQHTCLPLLQK